jgi:hypothetical protein
MTIAEQIKKTDISLKDRNIPEDSWFEVTFEDDSVITEKEANWSSMSHREAVSCFGKLKTCFVCDFQVKKIKIVMGDLETEVQVADDEKVYQYIRSERIVAKDVDNSNLVGRGVGLIRKESVTEERFLDRLANVVNGARA